MGRAEVGSTKHLSNKMKSKGLQRLRWYCQVCEKQCRDENGFKCHVNSESHVRQMQVVGEDPKKVIREYSNQFKNDFLTLLRTSHGEKPVVLNHFYQTYIADKQHIHQNATHWTSLTEFAKYLGREGICRVIESDKGLSIAWIDNSPEALRRQDALRRKEAQDRGDEEREQKLIKQQIKRAQEEQGEKDEKEDKDRILERKEGEKIGFSFGAKQRNDEKSPSEAAPNDNSPVNGAGATLQSPSVAAEPAASNAPIKLSLGSKAQGKSKNIFGGKKNPLASGKPAAPAAAKPMSNMERIMREEQERKRQREEPGGGGKRIKLAL